MPKIQQRRLAVLLAATLMGGAPATAVAADLFRASEGYTYFHRVGVDMATHDAAVDDCARQSLLTAEPYIGTADRLRATGGAIGSIFGPALEAYELKGVMRVYFAANLENCMVSRGWEVVRLDEGEGKAITALPQPEQAAILARMVGTPSPHGEVVRRPGPIGDLFGKGHFSENAGPSSLSLSAGTHGALLRDPPFTLSTDAVHIVQVLAVPVASRLPAGASVIVVRMTTTAPHQLPIYLARLSGPDNTPTEIDGIILPTPVKLFWKAGTHLERTYVAEVPQGHWRLMGPQGMSFCLGGPAFDIGAGEAVFVGTFDAAAPDPLIPDMDVEPARISIRGWDPGLAERLKPAAWHGGERFRCGLLQTTLIWNLDWPPKATPSSNPSN